MTKHLDESIFAMQLEFCVLSHDMDVYIINILKMHGLFGFCRNEPGSVFNQQYDMAYCVGPSRVFIAHQHTDKRY